MKTHKHLKTLRSIVTVSVCSMAIVPAALAQKAPTAEKMGLTAVLADDERLLSELSRRELDGLCEHMFKKLNIPADQQAVIKAVSSLKRLDDPSLTGRQRQELVRSVAVGIDRVLTIVKDPSELMRLSALLVEHGTKGGLNLLEYWGEDLRIQAQVRPIAEAVGRVYTQAIASAQTRKDKLESQMTTTALQTQLAPEWEKAARLIMAARFNAPFNLYTLALSMDKADARRQKICDEGIKLMTEFEDPQYEVVPVAAVCIGKLHMAKRTPEGIEQASKKFAEVLKDANAPWPQKFEAVYFTAVARALGGDVAGARRDMATAEKWLSDHAAPDAALRKGTQAAMKMLKYRIATIEAEHATGEAAQKANQAAVEILQDLLRDRPDLEGIINQQMIARLPEQPDVSKLNPLLLKALAAKGSDELAKEGSAPDKKILAQAAAAAREIIRRVGEESLTPEDGNRYMLRLAIFSDRLGQEMEAASLFLKHAETYHHDMKLANDVLDNAAAIIGRLMRAHADGQNADAAARTTQELYARFLQIATAAPFDRVEFNFEYGVLLLRRNASLMEGQYEPHKQQMLADAQKAVALFREITDEKQRLQARSYEMLAFDQMLDLAPAPQQAREYIARIQSLADEINELIRTELPKATDEAAKLSLKRSRVRTLLLAAKLAQHQDGAERTKGLERALSLLASFEQDVQGLPNGHTILSEGLLIRLQALMELGRTDEALKDLGKFLESRSDEQGLQVVIQMIESLNNEFDRAQQEHNNKRMAELAAHRAKVSRYLVERAAASSRQETRKLLPKYKMFEASSLQKAAELEKDPTIQRKYLTDALAIYDAALKETPDDRALQLWRALVQYDLRDYISAQRILAELMSKHLLGKPMVMVSTPEGDQMKPNQMYWNAMLKLLRCNVQLVNAKAPGFDQTVLEETKRLLKQLYITWGEPGGSRWAPQFDQLRKEIIPDWTIPPLDEPAAQPATQPQ